MGSHRRAQRQDAIVKMPNGNVVSASQVTYHEGAVPSPETLVAYQQISPEIVSQVMEIAMQEQR